MIILHTPNIYINLYVYRTTWTPLSSYPKLLCLSPSPKFAVWTQTHLKWLLSYWKLCLCMCSILLYCPTFVSSYYSDRPPHVLPPNSLSTNRLKACLAALTATVAVEAFWDFQYMLMKTLSCDSPGFLCTVTRFNLHHDNIINNQTMCTMWDKQ